MRASYHEDYEIPLPEGHPFPMRKFSALRRILIGEGIIAPTDLVAPDEVDWSDLELAHDRGYLDKLRLGTLNPVP